MHTLLIFKTQGLQTFIHEDDNRIYKTIKSRICPRVYSRFKSRLKPGFHRLMNRADEMHKTADLLDFEKIFSRCHRIVESAD